MIAIMMAMMCAQEEKLSYFPTGKGFEWTYQYASDDGKQGPRTWTLGEEKQITYRNGDSKQETIAARILTGFSPAPTYLLETKEGVRIVTERRIGYAGSPALVIAADLRWGKEKSWKFRTTEGCLVNEVQCKQDGTETVEVGAGKFDCLKVVNGNETYWLARGVGIVKRVTGNGDNNGRIVWELKSYVAK